MRPKRWPLAPFPWPWQVPRALEDPVAAVAAEDPVAAVAAAASERSGPGPGNAAASAVAAPTAAAAAAAVPEDDIYDGVDARSVGGQSVNTVRSGDHAFLPPPAVAGVQTEWVQGQDCGFHCPELVQRTRITVKDTAHEDQAGKHDVGEQYRQDPGNCCWLMANYGPLAQGPENEARRAVVEQLRRGPALVLLVCEAQPLLAEELSRRGSPANAPGADAAVAAGLAGRPAFQYLCMRGEERGPHEKSVMVAARTNVASQLRRVYWRVQYDGTYKDRGKLMQRQTRILAVEVSFDDPIVHLGWSHTVMVVHMHPATAKKHEEVEAYWRLLAEVIREHDVRVLGGDFNMALCRVVPGLRSCGVPVAVAAWYPWKTQHGLLAVDSCAIFFVGQAAVGQFRLQYDLEDLHDRDSTGLLWKESMVTEAQPPQPAGEGGCRQRDAPTETR